MFSYFEEHFRKILTEKSVNVDANGSVVSILGPIPLPIDVGGAKHLVKWYVFAKKTGLDTLFHIVEKAHTEQNQKLWMLMDSYLAVNSALVFGDPSGDEPLMTRIHSCCFTGDVFGSLRCDCGPQLHTAMSIMAEKGRGLVIYMSGHEGRGIGLYAKAATYLLQDMGLDTYEANEKLGLPKDSRDFEIAATFIKFLCGNGSIDLMTNNPLKIDQMKLHGITIHDRIPIVTGQNDVNQRYMAAKKKWGHLIK
jgi:GTP cyclohydrolase II